MGTGRRNRKAVWIGMDGYFRGLLTRGEVEGKKEAENLIGFCRKAGFDLIFLGTRDGDGKVIYQSRIERSICDWDALGFFCRKARENGMEIHPWIVLWDDITRLHPELHVKNRDGLTEKENRFCPARPESRQYFLAIIREVLGHDAADGVHLDLIRYLDKPCYCDYHRADFKNRHGADPLKLDQGSALWEAWNEYNVETITSFVREVSKEAHGRGQKLSAAVFMPVDRHRDAGGNPFSLDRIGKWDGHCDNCAVKSTDRCATCSRDYAIFQRWPDWCAKGYLDFVCPMNYTPDLELYRTMLDREMAMAAGVPLFSGISLYPDHTMEVTKEQIRQAFAKGAGVCFFEMSRLLQKSEREREELLKDETRVPTRRVKSQESRSS